MINKLNKYIVIKISKDLYLTIYDMIRFAMDNVKFIDNPSVEEILNTEQEVYKLLEENFK